MALDRTTTLMLRGLMVVAAAGVITVSAATIHNARSEDEDTELAVTVRPIQPTTASASAFPMPDPSAQGSIDYVNSMRELYPGLRQLKAEAFLQIGRDACTLLQSDSTTDSVAKRLSKAYDYKMSAETLATYVVQADRYLC